jgi:hypothetical protein
MFLSLNGPQIVTLYYKQLSGTRFGIQQNCRLVDYHILQDMLCTGGFINITVFEVKNVTG